ncbi:hypothetical protein GCM10009753_07930 [Streptantibioticus ferralitis]
MWRFPAPPPSAEARSVVVAGRPARGGARPDQGERPGTGGVPRTGRGIDSGVKFRMLARGRILGVWTSSGTGERGCAQRLRQRRWWATDGRGSVERFRQGLW